MENFANVYFSAVIASSLFAIIVYFIYIKKRKK